MKVRDQANVVESAFWRIADAGLFGCDFEGLKLRNDMGLLMLHLSERAAKDDYERATTLTGSLEDVNRKEV